MAVHKVIITCAVTGAIHTPSMSPHLPVTAEEITEAAVGAAEAGRGDRPSPCARREDRQARPVAGGLRALPAAHQAALERRREHHDRRRAGHDRGGAREAGRRLQARSRLAQHGVDELRAVPDARPLQGVQARLGAAGARGLARPGLPQHLQGRRVHPRDAGARAARASSSSATTPPISTTSRISSSAASSSRRCSSRPCSASSAASGRIPTT